MEELYCELDLVADLLLSSSSKHDITNVINLLSCVQLN
jgi:hypothetical protein